MQMFYFCLIYQLISIQRQLSPAQKFLIEKEKNKKKEKIIIFNPIPSILLQYTFISTILISCHSLSFFLIFLFFQFIILFFQITIAETAADVVRTCEYTFCMLSTMEASVAVVRKNLNIPLLLKGYKSTKNEYLFFIIHCRFLISPYPCIFSLHLYYTFVSYFRYFLHKFLSSILRWVQFDMENDGVIAGVSEGKVIIDCATLSPERMMFESDKIITK